LKGEGINERINSPWVLLAGMHDQTFVFSLYIDRYRQQNGKERSDPNEPGRSRLREHLCSGAKPLPQTTKIGFNGHFGTMCMHNYIAMIINSVHVKISQRKIAN
jgi:hypothetical protein